MTQICRDSEIKRYRVVKAYEDVPQNPISIEKGEILEVIEESDTGGDWPNWIFCRGNEKEGWIPKQILRLDGKRAVALESYTARELQLIIDEILLSEKELNGWIWCSRESSPELAGWAPLNHLREQDPE